MCLESGDDADTKAIRELLAKPCPVEIGLDRFPASVRRKLLVQAKRDAERHAVNQHGPGKKAGRREQKRSLGPSEEEAEGEGEDDDEDEEAGPSKRQRRPRGQTNDSEDGAENEEEEEEYEELPKKRSRGWPPKKAAPSSSSLPVASQSKKRGRGRPRKELRASITPDAVEHTPQLSPRMRIGRYQFTRSEFLSQTPSPTGGMEKRQGSSASRSQRPHHKRARRVGPRDRKGKKRQDEEEEELEEQSSGQGDIMIGSDEIGDFEGQEGSDDEAIWSEKNHTQLSLELEGEGEIPESDLEAVPESDLGEEVPDSDSDEEVPDSDPDTVPR